MIFVALCFSNFPLILSLYTFSKFTSPSVQCWEEKNPPRDPVTHELVGDHKRFPSGMGALGSYVRGKGLGFAMYTAESTETCGGYPASANYEDLDAKTFAKCELLTPLARSLSKLLPCGVLIKYRTLPRFTFYPTLLFSLFP